MQVLLTNDDGIDAPGLSALKNAISQIASFSTLVVAPDSNRSGVSNAISIHGPLRLSPRGEKSWACSGTPADCVLLASRGAFGLKPDLVLSGINMGPNIGTDIIYSGTAAAARQATLHGIPAIAFSLAGNSAPWHWETVSTYIAENLESFIELIKNDEFLNINLPNIPEGPQGQSLTWPSRRRYKDELSSFAAPNGDIYHFLKASDAKTLFEEGSDQWAIDKGLASISPIHIHPVVGEIPIENRFKEKA